MNMNKGINEFEVYTHGNGNPIKSRKYEQFSLGRDSFNSRVKRNQSQDTGEGNKSRKRLLQLFR